MSKIGYVRVSTENQNTDRQKIALSELGIQTIFIEKASGKKIPYKFTSRRPGDIAICYADPSKALKELGWKAERGLERMCEDSWRWQSMNPHGYE